MLWVAGGNPRPPALSDNPDILRQIDTVNLGVDSLLPVSASRPFWESLEDFQVTGQVARNTQSCRPNFIRWSAQTNKLIFV